MENSSRTTPDRKCIKISYLIEPSLFARPHLAEHMKAAFENAQKDVQETCYNSFLPFGLNPFQRGKTKPYHLLRRNIDDFVLDIQEPEPNAGD